MGLFLDDEGYPSPAPTDNGIPSSCQQTQEATLLKALLRIVANVMNYGTPATNKHPRSQSAASIHSIHSHEGDTQVARWTRIERDLSHWQAILPASFRPDIILLHNSREDNALSDIFAQDVWFSNAVCAAAMMSYHMARMILLTRRPIELFLESSAASQGQYDLLSACHGLQDQLRSHAKEIFAIAVGTTEDVVRVHMLQPLYVAGRCLTESSDRRFLVQMLRAVEEDLGIATEYRVKDLIQEWGVVHETIGIEQR